MKFLWKQSLFFKSSKKKLDSKKNYWKYPTLWKGTFGKINLIQSKNTLEFCIQKKIRKRQNKISILQEYQCLLALKPLDTIPNIIETFESNSYFYFVLDFCPGITLKQLIKESSLNISKIKICSNLITILNNIHQYNCLHGDINPNNILVYFDTQHNIQFKFIDFGRGYRYPYQYPYEIYNVYILGGGGMLGYCSPEILYREEYTAGTDCFSLGMVLYELFAENLPYIISFKKPFPKCKYDYFDSINQIYKFAKSFEKVPEIYKVLQKMLAIDKTNRPRIQTIYHEYFEKIKD